MQSEQIRYVAELYQPMYEEKVSAAIRANTCSCRDLNRIQVIHVDWRKQGEAMTYL